VLEAYIRNVKLALYAKAQSIYLGKSAPASGEVRS